MTKLTKEQEENYRLIENIPHKLIAQRKLAEKLNGLGISYAYSMCVGGLWVAEGGENLVLLGANSSDTKFSKIRPYKKAIKKFAEEKGYNEDDEEILKRIDGCEKYAYFTGLKERGESALDGVPGAEKLTIKEEGEEDSIDKRPYLLVGTVESFAGNKYEPEEIKILVPIGLADKLFGYGSAPQLKKINKEEIKRYNAFKEGQKTEKGRKEMTGQAFCRQTTAKIYGTKASPEPSDFNIALICEGARIRSSISMHAEDTKTFLDPKEIYLVSFSGTRFQQLFGSLDALLEKYGNKGSNIPTILNNVSMAY